MHSMYASPNRIFHESFETRRMICTAIPGIHHRHFKHFKHFIFTENSYFVAAMTTMLIKQAILNISFVKCRCLCVNVLFYVGSKCSTLKCFRSQCYKLEICVEFGILRLCGEMLKVLKLQSPGRQHFSGFIFFFQYSFQTIDLTPNL